ncbi:hypothetical protein [Sphingorhabdus sp.]|uniref:hypothetical protein n=1 Tax=Sphingorhabdus sp. TaxID=1902408 RepID=UPI00333EC9DD
MTTPLAVNSALKLAYAKYAVVNPQQPGTTPAAGATVTPMAADKLAIRPGNVGQPGGVQAAPAGGAAGGLKTPPTMSQPGGLQVPPNNNGIYSQAQNFGKQVGDAFGGVAKNWNNMPNAAKWTVGGGLGLGALGMMQGGNLGYGAGALGLGAAGLAGAGMGLFGDDARRMVGQGAMNTASFFGQNVPTAEHVNTSLNGGGGAAVQSLMDAKNEQGQAAGWGAGQAEIDKYKGQLGTLTGMGRDMGTTMLMGLPGEGAPQTAEAAGQMYDQLAQKHQEMADPKYLYNQALAQAKAKAQASTGAHVLGGIRRGFGAGSFLDNVVTGFTGAPQGNTPDEMAANELKKRYGEFPMQPPVQPPVQDKTSSVIQNLLHKFAMQQLITKSARCWAGYEPVPGKKPYSNDSCRPSGSGKKKPAKKPAEKAAKACTGKTTMTETASSRGETKVVDDKQKSTNSPKPEDAGATQTNTNN